jgi:hypothetical protein
MNLHHILDATANDATSNLREPLPRVEFLWYDRIARWLTHRLTSVIARTVIRAHRRLLGERLTPIHVQNSRMAVSPQDNCGDHLFYYGEYEPRQVELWNDSVVATKSRSSILVRILAIIRF